MYTYAPRHALLPSPDGTPAAPGLPRPSSNGLRPHVVLFSVGGAAAAAAERGRRSAVRAAPMAAPGAMRRAAEAFRCMYVCIDMHTHICTYMYI